MGSEMTPVHSGHFRTTPEGKFWAPVFSRGLYRFLRGTDEWRLEDGSPNPHLVEELKQRQAYNKAKLGKMSTGVMDRPDVASIQGWHHNYSNLFWAIAHSSVPFNLNWPGIPQGSRRNAKKVIKHPLQINDMQYDPELQYSCKLLLCNVPCFSDYLMICSSDYLIGSGPTLAILGCTPGYLHDEQLLPAAV